MIVFGSRKRIRHIAASVLVVWLFALGAGIANACLLEPQPGPGAHGGHGQTWAHEHHGNGGEGRDQPASHAGKSPCVKFCDESSFGATSAKQPFDPLNAVWLGPVAANSIAVVHPASHEDLKAIDPERWRGEIRIPIAFLRLTL